MRTAEAAVTRGRHSRPLLILFGALIAIVGISANATSAAAAAPPKHPTTAGVLTPDGAAYKYKSTAAGEVTVKSKKKTGGNEREFFWPNNAKVEADSTSCSTWQSGDGFSQQGEGLRITDTNGVIRGITVDRNVYGTAYWVMNLMTWDTSRPGQPYVGFAQIDLSGYLGNGPRPVYPLNVCARTVGDQVQFIVWKQGSAKPAWGSTTQGGSATIPAGQAPAAGYTGWYAGHIPAGTKDVFTNMTVDGVTLQ